MPRTGQRGGPLLELDGSKLMAGILALLVAEREERLRSGDRASLPKTEMLLTHAGLTTEEIARIMGKTVAAVRKTLQRERK